MNKVLITVPDLSRPGGVSSLFNILKLDKFENIQYFQIHGAKSKNPLIRVFDLIIIYLKFFFVVSKYQVVHVNPSFTVKSFLRDAIFVYIARLRGKKVMVYWHGWDPAYKEKVQNTSLLKFFKATYAKADISIVLGSVFATGLRSLGCEGPIHVESNAASDSFIKSPIKAKILEPGKQLILLFIARLEVTKGVYIAIDTVKKISSQFNVKLVIAGDGPEFEAVEKYILDNEISNVELKGYVSGETKHEVLLGADMLLLPTYHNEGMPISIIEAMLYALPIVSRPVGGIPDWVIEPANGFLVKSVLADDFALATNQLLAGAKQFNDISLSNIKKAEAFTPVAVTNRLNGYYSNL